MTILTLSGSSRIESSNSKLLDAFPLLFPDELFCRYVEVEDLPLFKADLDKAPWPKEVIEWRQALLLSKALIICIPEYIHNMPALIKNALEWVTSSGELMHKPVLPITFTPNPPRGEKAMQSLLWSLKALDAQIIGQLALYQQDVFFDKDEVVLSDESQELLQAGIGLL